MHVDQHAPGNFCWVELHTSSQEGAKQFYEPLFGWTHVDHPMGPDQVYTMFQIQGDFVSACYQDSSGPPPHWNIYVASENADATAEKAKELGGTVVMGPFDVFDAGRMCVIQDPTGAFFCVWQ